MATSVDPDVLLQREFVDRLSRSPVTVSGEVEPVARLITESCSRLLHVARVGLWLFNDDETELRCVDQFDDTTKRHSGGHVLAEHEFEAEFSALKSSLYVDANDPLVDPRTAGYVESYLRPHHITSMLDIVVRFGGKNLGTLCFEHIDHPHRWSQSEIDFCCMVGSQLSVLLERRELRRIESAERDTQERLRATQELDALKSRFLANVSHELRTPLTLLLGPVEDLLHGKESLSDEQRERLEIVRRGGARLRSQVNALLDFVAVEAKQARPTFESTDVSSFTRQLASMFDSTATSLRLSLRIECEPLADPVWVDREMWEKILLNLLSNAFKFTHEGEISVTLRSVGEGIELAVRDTGVGIPEHALPRLFERFYRVPDAGGRTIEGTGIGLALVKELVELHHGTVQVESKVGAGTTFTIFVPTAQTAAAAESSRARPSDLDPIKPRATAFEVQSLLSIGTSEAATASSFPATSGRRRILVVDDNADMRTYLQKLLVDRYEVELVRDGIEALEAARVRRPDLVLSDVMMPRLDGVGLLKRLRADPSTKSIPFVLLSARVDDIATIEGLREGADDYLPKPFSPPELLARVGTHIELARMRREATESALKDVFLGLAAHELRTPLTTLKLRLQLAERRIEEGASGSASEHLASALRALTRAEALAGELLSMSALESRRLDLSSEYTDLVAVCREAAAEESESFGREVTLELPDEGVHSMVDRERIGEIVEHLLSNALKFSPAASPVLLSLRTRDDEVIISVRDEGPGIPPEEIPHLFERFHRVPNIPVQVGSRVGLGVGLYISRALAELHGGRLEVSSSPGRGSTFALTLPLTPSERAPATA